MDFRNRWRMVVGLFVLLTGGAWGENTAAVEGTVVLSVDTPQGPRPLKRDLSGIVTYLVPDGHTLPARPVPPPVRMSQKGAKFAPGVLAVVKGQTVEFPNDDDIDHNVFSFSKTKKFDLGLYKKGVMKSVVFETPGYVPLFCSIHSNMNGHVFVVPSDLFGVTDATGRFSIPQVPLGKYKVRTWHRFLPEGSHSLEVTDLDVQKKEKVMVSIRLATDQEEE